MSKNKPRKPLTPRQIAQYKRFDEMGLYSKNAKKAGEKLRDERGSEYFKAIRAKRKHWREGLEDGNAHTESR